MDYTSLIVGELLGLMKAFYLPLLAPLIAWQLFVRFIRSSASEPAPAVGESSED